MMENEPQVAGSVRSVERAMDLLLALSHADRPMGQSELALAVGLPASTVRRLMAVHERLGFVRKDRGDYRLAAGVMVLAGAFLLGDSLVRAAQPILDELAVVSEESVSLQVRHGFDRVVILWKPSPRPLGITVQVGQRRPLLPGVAGHILAAAMPADEIDQLLRRNGVVRTAVGEVLSRDALLAKLDQVRRQGYSVSRGELDPLVLSIAAPVATVTSGTVATIVVSGVAGRMTDEKIEPLIVRVRQAGQDIANIYSRM